MPNKTKTEPLPYIEQLDLEPNHKGLKNLGNTCFFNSVLQNLAASSQLRAHLNAQKKPFLAGKPMHAALHETLLDLDRAKGGALSPNALFNALKARHPAFKGGKQQDSHEMLCAVFQSLDEESRAEREKRCAELMPAVLARWDAATVRRWAAATSLAECAGARAVAEALSGGDVAELAKCAAKGPKPPAIEAVAKAERELLLFECRALLNGSSGFLPQLLYGAQGDAGDAGLAAVLRPGFLPENVFGGLLDSSIECIQCQNRQTIYEKFNILSLSITAARPKLKMGNAKKHVRIDEVAEKMQKLKISGDPADCAAKNEGGDNNAQSPAKELISASSDEESTDAQSSDADVAVAKGLTIMDCIGFFTKKEVLDRENSVSCGSCKSGEGENNHTHSTSKQYLLQTLPDTLIVQLKRFQHVGKRLAKLQTRVDFEEHIDLARFLVRSDDGAAAQKTKYRLASIVEHRGALKSCGHYIAYVRSRRPPISAAKNDKTKDKKEKNEAEKEKNEAEKEKNEDKNDKTEENPSEKDTPRDDKTEQKRAEKDVWILCNDSKLTEVDFERVKEAMPYLLFYERLNQ